MQQLQDTNRITQVAFCLQSISTLNKYTSEYSLETDYI
jgi:hypothetical protein